MTPTFSYDNYRSAKGLSYFAIAGLSIVAAIDLLSVVISFAQIAIPDWAMDFDDGTSSSIWLLIQSILFLLQFPILILTMIMFLVWLNRANKNLTPLQGRDIEFSSGWAVGWWFIPFANLVKPFQVVREVWYESDPIVDTEHRFLSASLRSAPTYMAVWWAFWIISNIAENIAARVFDPDDMQTVTISGYAFVVSGILSCIAAGFAIKVVWDITQRQESRFRNLFTMRPQEPPSENSGYGSFRTW